MRRIHFYLFSFDLGMNLSALTFRIPPTFRIINIFINFRHLENGRKRFSKDKKKKSDNRVCVKSSHEVVTVFDRLCHLNGYPNRPSSLLEPPFLSVITLLCHTAGCPVLFDVIKKSSKMATDI